MKSIVSTMAAILIGSIATQASALEFTYRWSKGDYRCVNERDVQGYNQNYLGECGQVSGKTFEPFAISSEISGLQSISTKYKKADFSGSSLISCNFSKSELLSANFNGTRLYRTQWSEAQVKGSSFVGVMATSVSFAGADLDSVSFWSSSVTFANFKQAVLMNSTFAGAYLQEVNFENADLRNASLSHARLLDVNFKNADLRGTYFEGTQLASGNTWTGARFNADTRLPFSKDEAIQKGMVYSE